MPFKPLEIKISQIIFLNIYILNLITSRLIPVLKTTHYLNNKLVE